MTTQEREAPALAGERPVSRTPALRAGFSAFLIRGVRSTWLPVGLLGAVTVMALAYYEVSPVLTLTFGAYIVLGIALPGTLLWRWVHRRSGWFVADVAAGAVLGYALEVVFYIGARFVGQPLLVLVWPIATVLTFALVPKLRRFWRGAGASEPRTPAWFSWSIAGSLGVILLWSCTQFFRNHGLSWPGLAGPDPDSLFELALIGEAKHHLPLLSPWLPEQPLLYHWFVYADMAATSWVTGIEPQVLLLRLSLLPMVALSAVLFAVIARRLSGKWWTGPAAVVTSYFLLAPNPYHWPMARGFSYYGMSPLEDGSTFRTVMWTSPTATFGAVLLAGAMLVLLDLFKSDRLHWREQAGRWVLAALLMVAASGGKATAMPIVLGGLLLTLAVQLVFQRRLNRVAIVATGIALVCLAFAQFVLFGGVSQGTRIEPLAQMIIEPAPLTSGYLGGVVQKPHGWRIRMVIMGLLTVWVWAATWAGGIFLFIRKRVPSAPILMLLGIGLAGAMADLSLGQDGGSQGWFFSAARPYLSILAVVGVASVTRVEKLSRRSALAIVGALLAGAAIVYAVMRKTPATIPTEANMGSANAVGWELIWPYLAVYGVVLALIVALVRFRHRLGDLRPVVPLLAICLIAGTGFNTPVRLIKTSVQEAVRTSWSGAHEYPVVSYGTAEAGRWLRDHSSPNDLVATNAHCLQDYDPPDCDNRHFAISAYAERRVLVEGWGFTAQTHTQSAETGKDVMFVNYWDMTKLAFNDAAFNRPSAESIGRLRDGYGVRWLFVDESISVPPAAINQYATLRFSYGFCKVYEINR